jgi:hypothetical protein
MNNENLSFLRDNLKYLGFGGKLQLNEQLELLMDQDLKEFQLDTEAFFDDDHKMEATLYFRRSNQGDMYFFNKYIARLVLADDPEMDRTQTFYISKGTGVTFKEAYNLLLGRSVNKDLINIEGQKYNAWIQLNFGEKDQHGNYKVRQYRPQYGFDLEKILQKYPIAELKQEDLKAGLIKSLKKGNQHPVTFEKSSKTERMLIEANPQYKTINIFPYVTRGTETEPLGQNSAATQANRIKSGRKRGQEANEDEKEGGQEKKEEELEVAAAKRQSKRGIGL